VHPVLHATYRVHSDARSIEDRARAIAVEQSVEMPVAAIDNDFALAEIVGRVELIEQVHRGLFDVRIGLACETIGNDAGQLINMLFGNTSLHEDVVLLDADLPREMLAQFTGPRHGVAELRRRVRAGNRALTCSALKPQGLSPQKLADLAARFAQGGIDYIKDDHGLADQDYSPFAARVGEITAGLRKLEPARNSPASYVPSLSGDLDTMRRQLAIAADLGVDTVMIAPMVAGFANTRTLSAEHPRMAFIAHPTMAGTCRIAPALLLGKLFRLLGADAVIFPNYGGRFGFSAETCRDLADAARGDLHGLRPTMPVPAGGMAPDRVPEMLDFYGADTMLLIGGALLAARERLVKETAAFTATVRDHRYG
jgi:ribulose-bisphosphate carboxylase large chain